MTYRKITVEGKEYEYVVGKTHVKVKGLGAWPKESIGHLQGVMQPRVPESTETLIEQKLAVTPENIRNHIALHI